LALTNIAFEMEDLLPGTENQLAIRDRHGQRRSEQCCLQVGIAVAIMPSLFVAIVAVRRDQLIQNGGHVSLQPGLELNRTDRRCAADVKDIDNSSFDTRTEFPQYQRSQGHERYHRAGGRRSSTAGKE